jgi:hypothetical protein
MSLTFEMAWPHIRERKSFRYRVPGSEWSPWMNDLDKLGTIYLGWLLKLEFDIKREPREFTLRQWADGTITSVIANDPHFEVSHVVETFKVREVLDE